MLNNVVSNGPVNRGRQSPYCAVKIPRFVTLAITAITTVENAVLNLGGFQQSKNHVF